MCCEKPLTPLVLSCLQVAPAAGTELLRDSPGTSSGGRGPANEETNGSPTAAQGGQQQHPQANGGHAPNCRVPSCNQLLAGCTLYSQRMRCVVAVYLRRLTFPAAHCSGGLRASDREPAPQGVPRPSPGRRGAPC